MKVYFLPVLYRPNYLSLFISTDTLFLSYVDLTRFKTPGFLVYISKNDDTDKTGD
jgi:hypothetical protein